MPNHDNDERQELELKERLRQAQMLRLAVDCGVRYPNKYPYTKRTAPPSWLAGHSSDNSPIPPVDQLLRNSCFYPSSALDGRPILILLGHVHSFVYADYSCDRRCFQEEFPKLERHLRDYRCVQNREAPPEAVIPPGFQAQRPAQCNDPGEARPCRNHWGVWERGGAQLEPFVRWTLWQRNSNLASVTGPKYFSLLFVGGEGAACYQALYQQNGISPAAMALINPGHTMGGNYTMFTHPDAPLWRSVVESELGLPLHLLIHCSDFQAERFPEYSKLDSALVPEPGGVGGPMIDIYKRTD